MNWFSGSLLPSVKRKWVTDGKRCRALTLLYRTIPDVLDTTPCTAIFAPDAGGLCTDAPCTEVMVYLSPELEFESQEQVNFTVAHEFAHVVLKHSPLCWNPEQSKRDEQTADELAKEWGFARPKQPYRVNQEMLTVYRDFLASVSRSARAKTPDLFDYSGGTVPASQEPDQPVYKIDSVPRWIERRRENARRTTDAVIAGLSDKGKPVPAYLAIQARRGRPRGITSKTRDILERVRSLFNEGITQSGIARTLGCSPTRVRQWMKLAGIDYAARPTTVVRSEMQSLINQRVVHTLVALKRLSEGRSLREIAEEVDLSYRRLSTLLRKIGIDYRTLLLQNRRVHRQTEKAAILQPLLDEGLNQAQIAKRLGCTHQRVQQLMVTAGINYHAIDEARAAAQREARCAMQPVKPARVPGQTNGKVVPEYRVYCAMRQRCYNPRHPNYPRYGGRGVVVAPEWRGPDGWQHFNADMGPRPEGIDKNGRALYSIDRIDNVPLYSKATCRWATSKEQNARGNRRNPALGRKSTLRGKTWHQTSLHRDSTSGFKGVSYHKGDKRWRVQTKVEGKTLYLGSRRTALEAALLYDTRVVELLGPDAVTNASLGLLPAKKPVQSVTLESQQSNARVAMKPELKSGVYLVRL